MAGLKSKSRYFEEQLKCLDATVFTIQESHQSKKGLKLDGYTTVEAIRKNKKDGGAADVG